MMKANPKHMKKSFDTNLMLWIFLGVLGLSMGTANPFLHIPFAILLYPASLYKISRISSLPFKHGLIIGMFASAISLYWMSVAAHEHQQIPLVLAIPVPFIVGFYLGLWSGLFSWILSKVKDFGLFHRCAIAGLVWYLIEWIQSFMLSGFPWLTLTAGFVPLTPFIQGASIIGAYGLSGVFAFTACLLLEGFSTKFSWQGKSILGKNVLRTGIVAYGGIILLTCVFILGYIRLENAAIGKSPGNIDFTEITKITEDAGSAELVELTETSEIPKTSNAKSTTNMESEFLRILMVQGNMAQSLKWSSSIQQETLDKYFTLTQNAIWETRIQSITEGEANSNNNNNSSIDLIIWPETAMPFFYGDARILSSQLNIFAEEINIPMLFGSPAVEKGSDKYLNNRAYLLQNNAISQYDKEHLVPFGEYVPSWSQIGFIKNLLGGLGGFKPGTQISPLILENTGASLGVLICYEAIFPKLARQRVVEGAQIFINISNDAWYDYTSAAQQHLYNSSLRSVEQKRGMARGTNTGITAAIDPYGNISYATELFVDAVVVADISLENDRTIFFHISPYLPPLAIFSLLLLLYPFLIRQIGRSKK